jgi:aminoglycoside 6'-N-acetyltransferase I
MCEPPRCPESRTGEKSHVIRPDDADDHEVEIARFLDDPPEDEVVFVAEDGDARVVGFLEASVTNRADGCDGPRIGYVEGWYVEAGHRGRGVGRKLVQAAERWARQARCAEMASDCDLENDDACWAHLRVGFDAVGRGIHFRKDLAENDV